MSECVGRECCPYGLDEKFLDHLKDSAYEQGRADALDEIIKLAHEDVTTGNMIISLADVEQLKEQE